MNGWTQTCAFVIRPLRHQLDPVKGFQTKSVIYWSNFLCNFSVTLLPKHTHNINGLQQKVPIKGTANKSASKIENKRISAHAGFHSL